MKITALILSILLVFAFNACDNNVSGPGPSNSGSTYFPNGDGTWYKYDVTSTDSGGTKSVGFRSTTYTGTKVISDTTFQIQRDTLTIKSQSKEALSFFLKSDAGVSYYLDTSGVSQFLPDSLRKFISFDTRMKFLSFPVQEGKSWTVFKANFVYGAFQIPVVNISAKYAGKENINLNLASGAVTKEAERIDYTVALTIPDPQNPFNTNSKTLTASVWLVDNIGKAKAEGSALLVHAFDRGGIDFGDMNITVTQSLINYQIK